MPISWLGLLLGVGYLAFPAFQMVRTISRRSYGGIFSEEFPLFVLTLPVSPLGELLFKSRTFCRMCVYAVAALVNASALYFLGMGLTWLVRRISG